MKKKKQLIFLHYFGGAAKSWKWVIDFLDDDFDCVAVDLPGFGGTTPLPDLSIKSFASYVLQLIRSRNAGPAVLIGHSMSGKIALLAAAMAAQDEISQVILVAPSPPTTEPMPQKEKERMLHHPDHEEALQSVKTAVKAKLTDEQHEVAIQTQLIVDEKTWRWWILEGMEHSIADEVKDLRIPITVIASDDDPVITADIIQSRVLPVLKSAKLITTSGVGHLIPLEAPQWLAEQIRTTLNEKLKNY